jgi:hypothetical protein
MKLLSVSILALATGSLLACGSYEDVRLRRLAIEAVSDNPTIAASARAALRAQGQAGLDALLSTHSTGLQAGTNPARGIREAIDEVGQQKDCHASRLYWYTDLDSAIAAAKQAGKPILSLRLLGKLNEELSCANSRFFRTTLYANTEVSKVLRDRFILHWQSVRPAPRITVDFGDGRKIERTITGNSIHYVLDADGNPIDALPGLYGGKAFITALSRAEEVASKLRNAGSERETLLRAFHQERLEAIATEWARDLADAGAVMTPLPVAPITAAKDVRLTAAAVTPSSEYLQQLREASTDGFWARMAVAHSTDAVLDAGSRALIAQKNPNAWQAGRLAVSKAVVENPMLRLVRNLQRSIAEDTVRNEYLLHSQIHRWFADGQYPRRLDALNTKVYAELFLTPNSDPWLGLAEVDAFSALDNNGIVAVVRP